MFWIALTATHTHLSRLRGHRTVRENPYPELAGLRDRAGEHLTCRLYLITGDTRARERLEAEGAERHGSAARLWTIQTLRAHALRLPLAVFYFLGNNICNY